MKSNRPHVEKVHQLDLKYYQDRIAIVQAEHRMTLDNLRTEVRKMELRIQIMETL